MRRRIQLGVALSLCLIPCVAVIGQQSSKPEQEKFVIVPREIGLVTVAYQPDCPLQFEDVYFLAGVTGGGMTSYRLRNRGTKSIRSFKVGDTLGSTWSWDVAQYQGPVLPGNLVPQASQREAQIVSLTSDLRDKLKLRGLMQGMVVLMVIRVELVDGTVYDDETLYKASVSYMEGLDAKLNLLESFKRKCKTTDP